MTNSSNTLWLTVLAAIITAVTIVAFITSHSPSTRDTASANPSSSTEPVDTDETPTPEIGDRVLESGVEFLVTSVRVIYPPAPAAPPELAPPEPGMPAPPAPPAPEGIPAPPPVPVVEVNLKMRNLNNIPSEIYPSEQVFTDPSGNRHAPDPAAPIVIEPGHTVESSLHYQVAGLPPGVADNFGTLEVRGSGTGSGSDILLSAGRISPGQAPASTPGTEPGAPDETPPAGPDEQGATGGATGPR